MVLKRNWIVLMALIRHASGLHPNKWNLGCVVDILKGLTFKIHQRLPPAAETKRDHDYPACAVVGTSVGTQSDGTSHTYHWLGATLGPTMEITAHGSR
jgi:hypothetical protein